MTKQDFLKQLEVGLNGLPQEEIQERVVFYSEMIDDLIDEGLSEEDAVAKIGNVDDVIAQIVVDNHFAKQQTETPQKRKLRAWEIALLIIGAPVWAPLLMTMVAVAFSLYASLWAGIVSLWAGFVSLVACSLGGGVSGVVTMCHGYSLEGLAVVGTAFLCAGLSIFAFFGCKAVTKCIVLLTRRAILWVKNRFTKKEAAK